MHLEGQKKWLRLKFLTQLAVIFILTATLFVQYLYDRSLWRHLLHWIIGSMVAYGIIEIIYRKYSSLSHRLEEQLLQSERRISNQKALIDLSSSLALLRDEEQICRAAIQTLEQEFGYQRASIILQEPGSGKQRSFSRSGELPQESERRPRSGFRGEPFSPSSSPSKLPPSTQPAAAGLRIRAPLRNTAAQFGQLMVESNRSSPFTPEELSVVYAVANLVSISLQNVFHYKEQQHRQIEAEQRQHELAQREQSLALLNQINREALQARGFHSMVAAISAQICHLFSADTSLFALWDEQQKTLLIHHAHGYQAEWINSPLREPAMKVLGGALINSARVIPIAEPSISPWINPRLVERLESQSMLALPLIADEKKLGVILISYRGGACLWRTSCHSNCPGDF